MSLNHDLVRAAMDKRGGADGAKPDIPPFTIKLAGDTNLPEGLARLDMKPLANGEEKWCFPATCLLRLMIDWKTSGHSLQLKVEFSRGLGWCLSFMCCSSSAWQVKST